MAGQTTGIKFYFLLLVFFPYFRPTTLLHCPEYNQFMDPFTQNWQNRELCKTLDLHQSLMTGKYPDRVREGSGHVRFLSRRSAELICNFQQPRSIISNVIWHKVTRPRLTNYNFYDKRAFADGLFNKAVQLHPFSYPKMYAVNRPAGSSLFIQDMDTRDFGLYRCFATRYAIPFNDKYPQLMTVYQDIEFYPRHLGYEVLEK